MKYNFEINIVHYKELKERKQKLENELQKHDIKFSFIDNFDRKSLTKNEETIIKMIPMQILDKKIKCKMKFTDNSWRVNLIAKEAK